MIKLIVSDMDGTLVNDEKKIQKLNNKDNNFFIITQGDFRGQQIAFMLL